MQAPDGENTAREEIDRDRQKGKNSVSIRNVMGLLVGSLVVQLCFCFFLTAKFLSATETELTAIRGRLTDVLTESQTRYSQLYVIETSLATLIGSDDPKQLRNAYLNAMASRFMTPGDLSETDRKNFVILRQSVDDLWELRQQLTSAIAEAQRLWQSMRTVGTTIDARIPEKNIDRLFGSEHALAPTVAQIDAILDTYVDQFQLDVSADSPEAELLADLHRLKSAYLEVRKDRERLRTMALRKGNEAMAALDAVRHIYTENRTTKVLAHVEAIEQQVREMRPSLALMFILNATEFVVFLFFSVFLARPIERTSRILDEFHRTYEMPSALPHSNISEVQTLLRQLPLLLASIASEREKVDRMRSERDVYRGLSYTDGLTGISNRMAFERDNDTMMPLPVGTGLIVLDIDHFKSINDTYGHAFGDEVLRSVGSFLRGAARSCDRVYRYGGEEFCVVMQSTNREALTRVAERIRSGVERLEFTTPDGRTFSITASLGASLYDETTPVESLRALMATADEGLYAAKRNGRNQTVFRP